MSKQLASRFFIIYAVFIVALFLYSFTQIDLGLALTRFPLLFTIQRAFQEIGYFNRPLSTYLYVGILLLLTMGYIFILNAARKGLVDKKKLWIVLLGMAALLTFSYTAFSHDLFNYIFDAKIFTYYGQNPYERKALDFPGDPMLGFMHWTHRTYPYGPVWLGLTIPLSYMGLYYFLPTLLLFKLLMAASFLGTAYYISKITEKLFPGKELFAVSFFAFNPLVIIESLVSAHIDIVMLFFAVFSLFLFLQKRYVIAFVIFLLSIGIKFATVFLIPGIFLILVSQATKKKVHWQTFFLVSIACMTLGVIAATYVSGNFQPWYLLLVLPWAAFAAEKYYIMIPSVLISVSALLTYAPYLYLGHWNAPVPGMLQTLYIGAIVVSCIATSMYGLIKKRA